MFLLQTPDPFAQGQKVGPFDFSNKLFTSYESAFDPKRINNFFLTIEDNAKSLNTKVANGLTSNLQTIQTTLTEVYKQGLEYGFAYGDTKDYIEAITDGAKKMVNITTENVTKAIMLSKAMGITAKEVGAMYSNMMQMGIGQEKTRQILEKTFRDARAYGVDASTLTKTVSENIFKAQAYGFKDGVKGLTDMAIQAQRVGIGMELAAKVADKAFDPEGAIEMASSLQMLGGNMGGLTDVHSLMYMAQSDMGALQDTVLKASASMVDFNSKTGEFKISPEMRRNMTDQAKAMNMTYEEYSKMAIKYKKEQEVMSRIPLTAGFSEADKSFIASMAEIGPGGEIQIQMPGTDQILKGSDITAKKLEELKIAKTEAEKPIEDIAKDQLSVQKSMELSLETIKNQAIFQFSQSQINQNLKTTKDLTTYGTDAEVLKSYEELKTSFKTNSTSITQAVTDANTALKSIDVEVIKKLNTAVTDTVESMKSAIKTLKETAEKNTEEEAKPKVANDKTPTIIEDEEIKEDAEDLYLPAGNKKSIRSGFGELFSLNANDASLNIPEKNMESLFSAYNLVSKLSTERLNPLPMKDLSKAEPIERYVENKITTENKITNEVNIGGKTELEITLKTPDNNSEKILSLLLSNPELKETVMATINERLSKEYSDKLINVLPG